MKTIVTLIFVILTTFGFAFASQAIAPGADFPFFQIGCLIMGGLTIVSIKHRYEKLYVSEAIGSFALYTILVALFTSPVIEAIKTLVS